MCISGILIVYRVDLKSPLLSYVLISRPDKVHLKTDALSSPRGCHELFSNGIGGRIVPRLIRFSILYPSLVYFWK